MYRILTLSLALFGFNAFFCPIGLAQEETLAPEASPSPENKGVSQVQGRIVIDPISQEQFDLFLDSIRSSTPLRLPQPKLTHRVDSNTAGIWAGSTTTVDSAITDLTLRFRRKAGELVAPSVADAADVSIDQLLEGFELVLKRDDKSLFIQHSKPELRSDLYGVKVRIHKPNVPARTPFFRGQRDSGMYISVPPFADPKRAWGVLVCPRRLVKEQLTHRGLPEYILGPSPYELSEVKMNFTSKSDATMSTGGGEGRLKIQLDLTKDLPDGRFSFDQSVSAMPRATFMYQPKTPMDFFRFAPYKDVQQGGILSVEMENKVGYLRRQNFANVLYLHKMTEPSPISVVANGRRVSKDLGECYAVVVHQYDWMEYERNGKPL